MLERLEFVGVDGMNGHLSGSEYLFKRRIDERDRHARGAVHLTLDLHGGGLGRQILLQSRAVRQAQQVGLGRDMTGGKLNLDTLGEMRVAHDRAARCGSHRVELRGDEGRTERATGFDERCVLAEGQRMQRIMRLDPNQIR